MTGGDSPVTIKMKDGRTFENVSLDGGGSMIVGPNAGLRELHGTMPNDEFFCEFEDEIEMIDNVPYVPGTR